MKMIFNYDANKTHFHKKGTPWRILVVVSGRSSKWCHRIVWSMRPINCGFRSLKGMANIVIYAVNKLYSEVMNIWKSYLWTAEWRITRMKIIAVEYATFAVAKRKPEKIIRLVRDSNPWPLRYRCSALPIKLTSQLGAGHWIGSL